MPRPCGPSRRKVSGTRPQPSASETTYAASLRSARVPSGKSHNGRSPATGLETTRRPPISPTNVALDAGITRPWSVSSPERSSSSRTTGGSRGIATAEAVGADAEVAFGVDRVAADRAVGTTGLDHELGPLDEGAGRAGLQPDQEHL